jgi:hypothetical protein
VVAFHPLEVFHTAFFSTQMLESQFLRPLVKLSQTPTHMKKIAVRQVSTLPGGWQPPPTTILIHRPFSTYDSSCKS